MRKTVLSATSIVMVSALLIFSSGCSKRPSDDTITKDIQTQVAADPDTKDSNVSVASKDGKVTLTGTASDPAAQRKLEQIASQEPGTVGVDDQTAIPPHRSSFLPARICRHHDQPGARLQDEPIRPVFHRECGATCDG